MYSTIILFIIFVILIYTLYYTFYNNYGLFLFIILILFTGFFMKEFIDEKINSFYKRIDNIKNIFIPKK
jgi:hypothetical protein